MDYAGVMTGPVDDVMLAWMQTDGLDPARCAAYFAELSDRSLTEEHGPVHGLETGESAPEVFEQALAAELAASGMGTVTAEGLLDRMLGGLTPDPEMADVVAKARATGVRTALLSNSWGRPYPDRDGWDRLFDTAVISDEVGLRKPDPEIYRLACERLGVEPEQAVFVDDMRLNVEGAEALGMAAVLHTDLATTLPELERLLGIPLR
jgi:epoxide hydrolase-like predicted phosphatase